MSDFIENILIPIDFSDTSINALKCGIDLARTLQATVEITHSFTIMASGGDTALFVNESVIENHRNLNIKKIEDQLKQIPEMNGVKYNITAEFGQTSNNIIQRSKNSGADLIIVGMKREGGILDKLIGSTAYDLMNSSDTPVLAIPENIHRIVWKNIVIAFDRSNQSIGNFKEWIQFLSEKYNSNFEVVHVVNPEGNDMIQHETINYESIFDSIPYHLSQIFGVSTEKRLIQFIKEINGNLMILFPRKDHLFTHLFSKSVTKALAEKLHIPILTFHQ